MSSNERRKFSVEVAMKKKLSLSSPLPIRRRSMSVQSESVISAAPTRKQTIELPVIKQPPARTTSLALVSTIENIIEQHSLVNPALATHQIEQYKVIKAHVGQAVPTDEPDTVSKFGNVTLAGVRSTDTSIDVTQTSILSSEVCGLNQLPWVKVDQTSPSKSPNITTMTQNKPTSAIDGDDLILHHNLSNRGTNMFTNLEREQTLPLSAEFCPLAVPRHHEKPKCEVCGGKPRRICAYCEMTHYCSEEHFKRDGFHNEVCFLLENIRKVKIDREMYLRQRASAQNEFMVKELLTKLQGIASRYMIMQRYQTASGYFRRADVLAKFLYGPASIELCYLYLCQAESYLATGNIREANKSMVAVYGLCTYEPRLSEDVDMMLDLGFLEAQIHMAGMEWDDALFKMSDTLYQCSMKYGPNSIKTAKMYFSMGQIFYYKKQLPKSESLFVHSLENYLEWILLTFEENYDNIEEQAIMIRSNGVEVKELPLYLENDVMSRLKKLHLIFRKRKDSIYAKCLVALGIFSFLKGAVATCGDFIANSSPYLDRDRDASLFEYIDTVSWLVHIAPDVDATRAQEKKLKTFKTFALVPMSPRPSMTIESKSTGSGGKEALILPKHE